MSYYSSRQSAQRKKPFDESIRLKPEDRFVFCCARSSVSATAADEIASLIRHGLDWHQVLERLAYHRVQPLAYQTLRDYSADDIPTPYLLELRRRFQLNTIANLQRTRELLQLVEWLQNLGVVGIPFKGPTLAIMVYSDPGLREFHDLDLLVHPHDYLRTQELLLASGYRLQEAWEWQSALVNSDRSLTVGLHQALAPGHFPLRLDFQRLASRAESVPLLGHQLTTFCPEDMLLFLCIQFSRDLWLAPHVRLSKLCDIAELSRARPDLNWERIREEARRLGCERMLSLGVSTACELLGAPTPFSTRGDGDARLRAHAISRLVERTGPGAQRPLLSASTFHFLVRERWREKLYPAYRYLIPGKKDLDFIDLPHYLAFLYYIVRPARIARDVSRRCWRSFARAVSR